MKYTPDNSWSTDKMYQEITDWSYSGDPKAAEKSLETLKHWRLPAWQSMPLIDYAIETCSAWAFDTDDPLKIAFLRVQIEYLEYKIEVAQDPGYAFYKALSAIRPAFKTDISK